MGNYNYNKYYAYKRALKIFSHEIYTAAYNTGTHIITVKIGLHKRD